MRDWEGVDYLLLLELLFCLVWLIGFNIIEFSVVILVGGLRWSLVRANFVGLVVVLSYHCFLDCGRWFGSGCRRALM